MRSEGQCDLEWIVQADHTFSAGESKRELYSKTINWLEERDRQKKEWQNWQI